MSTLRELVTKWRGVTVGESNHGSLRPLTATEADVAHICADQLAAALVAEGRGDATVDELKARLKEAQSEFAIQARACGNWREWPEKIVSTEVPDWTHEDWKAATRAIMERDELRAAAAPSLHKEGAGGAVNELRALAEQFSIKGHAVIANPDRARAYEECSGSLINLAQKLSRAAETESAPLPLQRTLPDEQFKGVVVEAIGTEGERRTIQEVLQLHVDSSESMYETFKRIGDIQGMDIQSGITAGLKRAIEVADNLAAASPAGRAEQPK